MGFLKLIVHFFFVFSCRGWSVGGGRGNRSRGGWELQWCGPEGWRRVVPEGGTQTKKKWGPERVGRRKVGGPEGVGGPNLERVEPRKGGAPKGGRPKISRFFFPFPATVFALFVSLWGSSRGILVVFGSAGAVKCARLEFSGCRVKPRRPQSRGGFTPTARSLETAETIADCCISEFAKARVIWNRRRIGR